MEQLMDNYSLSAEDKALFDEYVSVRGLKKISAREYLYIISAFLRDRSVALLDVAAIDAEAYYQAMLTRQHDHTLSSYTVSVRIKICSDFYAWLRDSEYIDTNPFSHISVPVLEDRPFTEKVPTASEIDDALAAAEEMGEDAYLALCLVVRMALTDTDIRTLKKDCVIEHEGVVAFRFFDEDGKTPDRYVTVPEDLKAAVLEYVSKCSTEYMFPSNRKKQYSVKGLERRNEKIMMAAGLKGKYSMKDFRTRAILQMLYDGADEREVCRYANLSMRRIHSYQASPLMGSMMLASCPANVSRLKIVGA